MFCIILCAGVGGVLYGYDIGVISGALTFMQQSIALTSQQQELIVGAVLAGGLIGTLITGSCADRFGRRTVILSACAFFAIGVLLIVVAHSFLAVFIARIFLGIGVGVVAVAIPLYLSEIAPPHIRGRGVTTFQIFLTAGIMLAYLVDLLFTHSGDWRAMFALILIPTATLFLSMLFLPETPRWLLAHKQEAKARKILQKILDPRVIDIEIKTIQKGLQHTENSWRLLFSPQFIKPLCLALFIAVSNQLTGINVIFQYAPKVMDMAGMPTHLISMLATLGLGCVNFISTLIAMMLVDAIGRKHLLIIGTLGLVAANLFLGACNYFFAVGSMQAHFIIVGLCFYVIFFAIGPGVVVWLAISELLPTRVRGKAIALCLFANSLAATALSSSFLTLLHSIGMAATYWLFAICCFLYYLAARYGLPETKGRQLEDIQAEYQTLKLQSDAI